MKKIAALSAMVLILAASLFAKPVEVYKIQLAPGTDAYRYAADKGWEVFYAMEEQLLVSGRPVANAERIYQGDSKNLKWAYQRKGFSAAVPAQKSIFFHNGSYLLEASDIKQSSARGNEAFIIKDFSGEPIRLNANVNVLGTALARDSSIATLTHLIDIAGVAADVESLQAFNTRSTVAPNHQQVTEWIRDEFLSYGITDVVIDSFIDPSFTSYTQSYFSNSETYKIRNVIATIPGALDTESVYVVGGHFDTSVWPYNPWAPGADDNGSGTTAVLQTARILAANPPNTTVKLVALDCEEWGLYGAEHYAAQVLSQGMKVQCMLNYDMIGSIGNDSLFVSKLYPGSETYAHLLGLMAVWYGRTSDTNLVPVYNSVYLNGSDSWEFYLRGFPVTYSEEYNFSPVYHQTNDSTSYMNMRYCTSNIKAGVGLLTTMANYPQKVSGLVVNDVGNGSQLYVQWQPNKAVNINGYKIYWGKSSGNYTDSLQVAGTADTIGGLIADSLYYVGLSALDADGKESPLINEMAGIPRAAPLAPSGLTATPVDSGVTLCWNKNLELDLAGYDIYRKIDNGSFDSLTSTADTVYLNKSLSGAGRYYYKIQAKDTDGNKGLLSDSIYCRPITLDQGILMVDETNNWTAGSFPRDAQQDSFYNYILAGYKYEQHEYGSSPQKPILADFGPYSSVVWLADDYATLLASGAVNDMKSYLDKGGKLWFAGWKPSSNVHNSITYPADYTAGDISYDHFKISHSELSGTTDSFKTATGLKGYPVINVDTLKYPSTTWGKVLRNVEALTPAGTGDTIYVIDMKNDGSAFEGKACAVRDSGKTVFFGFPLYFMDKEQVKLAAQKVLSEFGEPSGVAGKPDNRERITAFRLFPNAPNPLNNKTTIKYQLPQAGPVKLSVYNIAGQLVKTLVSGDQPAGSYTLNWDRKDNHNKPVSAGVYIYHLSAGDNTQSRKMIVLK
ncbi:MAG: M28 family peptidase [Candidatus Edwardsbacteria bacterium]|nr:M28 family peptidase [Candidatus Edwardsbacteria bacterium]